MDSQNPRPAAELVGNAFVSQYYPLLHRSPELAYGFYNNDSILVRPNPDGTMRSATLEEATKEIFSIKESVRAEIDTVVSHAALDDGVVVLVKGYLTGSDQVRKRFTQMFSLAHHVENNYYVLDDVLRYEDQDDSEQDSDREEQKKTTLEESYFEVSEGEDYDKTFVDYIEVFGEEHRRIFEEDYVDVLDEKEDDISASFVMPEAELVIHETEIRESPVIQEESPVIQEKATKKSYASVVKAMRANPAPLRANHAPLAIRTPST